MTEMICFLCKKRFNNLTILIKHLKLFHNLKTHNEFQCCFENCAQRFPNIKSFRKHSKINHEHRCLKIKDSIKSTNNTEIINCESISDIFDKDTINDNVNNSSQKPKLCTDENTFTNSNSPHLPLDEPVPFELNTLLNSIHKLAIEFLLGFHNYDNFAIKYILNIQEGVITKIVKPILNVIKLFADAKLKNNPAYYDLCVLLNACNDPFKYCFSNHRLLNWLVDNDYLQNPLQFTINNEITEVFYNGEIMYNESKSKGVLLPLKFQFRKIFERDDELLKTIDRMETYSHESENLSNFIQGKLWKEKISKQRNRISVPYFLFVDDLEVNNPLGSRATIHSIANLYYSFPCSGNSTKLCNIYLAAIIKSSDMRQFGNDKSLMSLINELRCLEEEGIDIKTSVGIKRVHFILGLVLGDNLGINSILNFSKSFSSNHFCRFCNDTKFVTRTLCEENPLSLRNINNYEKDLEEMSGGVTQNSILNNIKSFHVTKNYAVDVMHDVFEGVCHYDMCHIISYFTEKIKYFSLDTLNSRKKLFSYGSIEIGNISSQIKPEHLKKFHLKMNAREVMNFVHFFPLIIGDLVPNDDEVWLFFLNLLEIIDMLLSFQMPTSYVNLLTKSIKQHNTDYMRLFNDTLKPKHHFLIHYPNIILNSGPPRNYWCFRFEAKHKQFKSYAQSITSRRNICLSLAKKYQYKFAYNLICNHCDYTLKQCHLTDTSYSEVIAIRLNIAKTDFICYTEIKNYGTTYKKSNYLTIFNNVLHVYEICEIVVKLNTNDVFIICREVQVIGFEPHFAAYAVDPNQPSKDVDIIDIKRFSGPPINLNKLLTGHYMVRLKEHF